MSHPLLSRAEIQALLGQTQQSTPESHSPLGLRETGTGVAAWHELVTLIWQSVANALSSPARPVRARIVRETLINQPLPALRNNGEGAEKLIFVQLAASPDWLGSFLVLADTAAGRLEEMSGGEWPPAAGTLPGLPDAVDYPAAFSELVADEMRAVLRDVIEVTAQVLPRGVAALPESARDANDAPAWLGVEIELGWGKQSTHLLHLFSPSLPALLYRTLSGPAAQQQPEAGSRPLGEGVDFPPGRGEDELSLLGTTEAATLAQAAPDLAHTGPEEAAAILPDRGILRMGSRSRQEQGLGPTRRSGGSREAGFPDVRDVPDSPNSPVLVRPVSFAPLEGGQESTDEGDNMDLLMDIPLDITVELGRTSLSMREVLALGKGSILELDHMAGEPVDILVNGRLIAKGEVVVVDDTFGVKISAIVSPGERLREGGASQGA